MNQLIKQHYKTKSLLWKCIAASLALHLSLLYFFSKYPLTLSSSSFFLKTRPNPKEIAYDPEISYKENNKALEEVFNSIVVLPADLNEPYDLVSFPNSIAKAPDLEDSVSLTPEEAFFSPVEVDSLDTALSYPEAFSPVDDSSLDSYSLAAPDQSSFSSIESSESLKKVVSALPDIVRIDAPKDDAIAQEDPVEAYAFYEPETEFSSDRDLVQSYAKQPLVVPDLKTPSEGVSSLASAENFGKTDIHSQRLITAPSPLSQNRDLVVPYATSGLTDVDDQLLFQIASVLQWNDDFNVDVKLVPSTNEEEGYIFSLALTPKYDLTSEKITQNFYFLIDRSSSVERHRFSLFKRAALKALATLQDGDRFNILILDKKISRLSPKNLPYNLKSMHLAEDFLEKQSQANFFSSTDLYGSLETILSEIPDTNEVHTAILLTNGQTSLSFANQQKSIKSYLEKNNGKLSLYAAAVGQNNNIVNLDMLCSLSGGKLLYSDTNAAFPRKLSVMVKSLRTPVAKDLLISAVPLNPKANVTILPASAHLPTFYSNEPYIIMGTIDRLSDFNLVIQGKHDDEWVSINKVISFQNAKADNNIKREWKTRQINQHYNDFLKEAKSKHLKEAKELLKSTYGKVAFE